MLHVHQESWDHGYHSHSQIRMVFFGYHFSRTLVMTFLEHPLQLNVLWLHPHHRWCIDPTSSASRGAACLLEYTLASAYRARLRSASWLKFGFTFFTLREEWEELSGNQGLRAVSSRNDRTGIFSKLSQILARIGLNSTGPMAKHKMPWDPEATPVNLRASQF